MLIVYGGESIILEWIVEKDMLACAQRDSNSKK
jgi:hypothetical protein